MAESLASMVAYLQAQNENSLGSSIRRGVNNFFDGMVQRQAELQKQDMELAEKVAQERRERAFFGNQRKDRTEGGLILAQNDGTPDNSNQPGPMETLAMQFNQAHPNQAKFVSAALSQPATMHSFNPEDKVTYNSKGEFTVTRGGNTSAEAKPNKPIYYIDDSGRATDHRGNEVTEVPANAEIIRRSATARPDFDASRATPQEVALAKAIIEGRANSNQVASMRGNRREYYAQLVASIDPTFDLSVAPQRVAIRKDFTPAGNSGKALTSLNTVIGHLDTLYAATDALDNKAITKYNNVANYAKNNIGRPEVKKFEAAKTLVVGELGKIAQGSGVVAQEEREEFNRNINAADSTEQIKGVCETYMDLIKSRTTAIGYNWKQTMGDLEPPIPIINEKSKSTLIKHGYDPVTLEKTQTASGTIRVRNKLTGKTGSMPAANFNAEKYEKI